MSGGFPVTIRVKSASPDQTSRGRVVLERTRHIWKRRIQGRLFDAAGMQALLDERERNTLEDHMGFRGQFPEHRRFQIDELKKLGLRPSNSVLEIGCGPLTA